VERVKRDADRQKNIQVRWFVLDATAGQDPGEILEQKISVFKEAQHAEIHRHADPKPQTALPRRVHLAHFPAEIKVERGRRKQQCRKWRIPGAVENVARDYQQIFAPVP
jgi:hypothetical protein